MAESIVSFVLDKLADATVQELLHLYGVDKQVKLLSNELGWIQAFLKDADRKNYNGDERQRHWVKEIREVAYDIEDIIDKACLLGIEMDDLKKRHSERESAKRIFKIPKKLHARHELGIEINEILERIKKISESREKYGTNNLGEGSGGQIELPVRKLLVPEFDDPDVVGFDQDRANIIEQLLDERIERRSVVSIVGPGGLGKTTIARKVYNSCDVKTTFILRIWITISQKFDLVDILRKLLAQIPSKPIKEMEQEQTEEFFHTKVYKSLLETKYLVVLDDVWTQDLWIQIEEAFPDTKNGSRVLMTTRSSDVANSADSTCEPYKLSYLTDETSLTLLLRKALPNQDPSKDYPNNLYNLAKEFVKKCGGLPLALIVLGGLLSKQLPNDHSWRKVLQKMNWRANASKVLATSYEDLSFSLKSCFMYFSIFPEDYIIDARALIRMWIAEGFIPHDNNIEGTLEDIAENILENLVQRSMIQIYSRYSNGSINRCYTHDLLRDIAIRKAEEGNFVMTSSNPDHQNSCRGARRVAFHHNKCNELMKVAIPNLRSVLCFKGIPSIERHRYLKVLSIMEADRASAISLSDEKVVYELLASLRYLQLQKGHYCIQFVESKNISFLQTLDLRFALSVDLPESIWHVRTLRHALLPYAKYTYGPLPLVDMRNLQTLSSVKPRLSWQVEGLPNLPSLRELHMEIEKGLPWEVVVNFISTLKNLEILTILGLRPEQDIEIRNTWKHIYFNKEIFY